MAALGTHGVDCPFNGGSCYRDECVGRCTAAKEVERLDSELARYERLEAILRDRSGWNVIDDVLTDWENS